MEENVQRLNKLRLASGVCPELVRNRKNVFSARIRGQCRVAIIQTQSLSLTRIRARPRSPTARRQKLLLHLTEYNLQLRYLMYIQ